MALEESTASLNALYFLPEFTFSNTTFKPTTGTEVELADGIIWLGDRALVLQMKERTADPSGFNFDTVKWFKKKVLGHATKQIRDTIAYLTDNAFISAQNMRGQQVQLRKSCLVELHKAVVYSCKLRKGAKHHRSRTAGFIHIFLKEDYDGVVRTLATLNELFEYLAWRELRLTNDPNLVELPENALLGHYLWGNPQTIPTAGDTKYLHALQQDLDQWDLSGILHRFLERSYTGLEGTNYHRIIAEVAKLNRIGLKAFKERFALSMERARSGEFTLPYRFSIPQNDCGFVFAPLEEERRSNRLVALHNFTIANMYDQRLSKCVGLTFLADPDGFYTVDWCFINSPWVRDEGLEKLLKDCYPFRPISDKRVNRYQFSPEGLG